MRTPAAERLARRGGTGDLSGIVSGLSLEQLRSALATVLRDVPAVAAAYAYGSRVRGRPLAFSDLDLALVPVEPDAGEADPLLAERVAARLAAALGVPFEVDAHLTDRLPLPVRGRVVTEGLLVFERDPSRRVAFETATRREYFDFLPTLKRDARAALRAGG